jgi:hypothetical protein
VATFHLAGEKNSKRVHGGPPDTKEGSTPTTGATVNELRPRLVSDLGRKPLHHLGQDHMGQGTRLVHFGRWGFRETRRISVGPGILAQVVHAVDQQIQRVVDPLALASQGGEIVCLFERLIVPGKKCLQCFLGGLLAVSSTSAGSSARHRSTRRRSWPAFRSQAAVFSTSTGSCAIENYAFANHRGGKRRFEVELSPEVAGSGHKDVPRGAEMSKRAVSGPASLLLRRRIVWYDNHQIVVAVGPRFTSRDGTEQQDALRAIHLHQPADHLGQHRIVSRWCLAPVCLPRSHNETHSVCHNDTLPARSIRLPSTARPRRSRLAGREKTYPGWPANPVSSCDRVGSAAV